MSLVFTLFTVGYILGVWTACLVFRQPQRAFEEGTLRGLADGRPEPAIAIAPPAVAELIRQ